MENKCQGNEKKFYLENLINTMDKMEKDGGNKAQ